MKDDRVDAPGSGSGIMRGMNDPEIKPAPALPWYRAIVTRTPRGRKLRRRGLLVLALLGLPWWTQWLFGMDPRFIAAKLGLREMPDYAVFQRCHKPSDCTKTTCAYGYPICMRGAFDSDPKDPEGGSCQCLSKERDAARRQPPAWCKDPQLVAETPNGFDWKCLGGSTLDVPDAGRKKEEGP